MKKCALVLSDAQELLPPSVRDIINIIGTRATLALVDEFGGRTWRFSRGYRGPGEIRAARMAEVIGQAESDRLIETLGKIAAPVYIPACSAALRALRNSEIIQRFDALTGTHDPPYSANDAVFELAGQYKMCDRQIWRVLKGLQPVVAVQANLF